MTVGDEANKRLDLEQSKILEISRTLFDSYTYFHLRSGPYFSSVIQTGIPFSFYMVVWEFPGFFYTHRIEQPQNAKAQQNHITSFEPFSKLCPITTFGRLLPDYIR